MKANKLREIDTSNTESVNRVLAEIRLRKPTEIVIWWTTKEACGVMTSKHADRTKIVGALTVAAMDVWNA